MKKIAVIGAGITGLAFAYLASKKHHVDVYEKAAVPGGLGRGFQIEDTQLEAFYHHFFKTDRALVGLIGELGLKDRIQFYNSSVAINYKEEMFPFTTPKDLLQFKRLSFFSRITFGFQTLYLRRNKEWQKLEHFSVKEWMNKYYGNQIYNEIWKPLLYAKFGEYADSIPMSWLWGRIHPRASSREKGVESLGYLKGSLALLFDELVHRITEQGGRVLTQSKVKSVAANSRNVKVATKDSGKTYNKVVLTIDANETTQVVCELPKELLLKLKTIKYYGIICCVFKLAKSLGKIYWINNADANLPISGIIEHTNLAPEADYNGYHIIYVFKYLSAEHYLYSENNNKIVTLFCDTVGQMFPSFNKTDILETFLFKTPNATPVYYGKYSSSMPGVELIPGQVYMANTSQIYPEDRNLNNGIVLAKRLEAMF